MVDDIVFFKDELLLLRWGDNSRDGMTVTFQLPGEYDTHPFKHSPTGKKTGKRYAAVLVEINDDETPVVQKLKGGRLSREAAGLSKREDFQKWTQRMRGFGYSAPAELWENLATEYIKDRCCIDSRAQLDHIQGAANEFAHIKREFHEWQKDAA